MDLNDLVKHLERGGPERVAQVLEEYAERRRPVVEFRNVTWGNLSTTSDNVIRFVTSGAIT